MFLGLFSFAKPHFWTESEHKQNATLPRNNRESNCYHPDSFRSTGNSYFEAHLAMQSTMNLELECRKLTSLTQRPLISLSIRPLP